MCQSEGPARRLPADSGTPTHALSARLRIPRRGITVAFYTVGDTRPAGTDGDMTSMYRRLAEHLATPNWAKGVRTAEAAAAELRDARRRGLRVARLYFVGHGTGTQGGGFFFSGQPDPERDFTADPTQTFIDVDQPGDDPARERQNQDLIRAIATVVEGLESAEIGFLACFVGQGRIIPNLARELHHLAPHVATSVAGYRGYFAASYTTDAAGATTWRNQVINTDELGEDLGTGVEDLVDTPPPATIPTYEVLHPSGPR